MADGLSDLFDDCLTGASSPENLFSLLESFEDATEDAIPFTPFQETDFASPRGINEAKTDEEESPPARKKLKPSDIPPEAFEDGMNKMSHITVERNRRKQMNDHLSVLRSLMPCFYVKRGDQASIIGGVVDYIKELRQVLQSLEAKKQRKAYTEVLSPRAVSSPRPTPMSPRPTPMSPRPSPLSPIMSLPISPRTPQPGSPYKPNKMQYSCLNPTIVSCHELSPCFEASSAEIAANSKSAVAEVEVKFSGPNLLLKTVSHRIPGQPLKIISALEGLALEILHVSISTNDDTMLNSFTIKIGIECELSAEELAQEIQQTFS